MRFVSDPLSTSRTAREALARGLNALQADPSVPPQLVDLAAPIAQAMGALHQLEKTNQLAPHADVALGHMRGALAKLQAAGTGHPAVLAATDSVAQSMSLVHSLSKMANGPAAAPPAPPPQAPPPQPQPAQAAALAGTVNLNAGGPNPRGVTAGMPASPPVAQPAPAFPQPTPQQQQLAHAATAAAPPQMIARDPFAAPPQQQQQAPVPMGAAAPPPAGKPASPSMPVPAPPRVGNVQLIVADLGAHSATNFYKGLSGNDIIDHGGLFVSTYVPPKIGTQIRLKVSLPGGYEFEANAVVKWTREQGDDATPGFGAQFTGITPEARQLVYRYVRNREPLFHDDF